MSLYDAVMNKRVNPLMLSQGEALTSQLQAASGKEATAVPRTTSLGERVAAAQAREEEAKVVEEAGRQEAALQLQQQAAQAEIEFQGRELNEQALNLKQQMQQKAESLLSEFIQGQQKLEGQRAQSRAEVATFMMRLTNEQYVNSLKQEGIRSRLTSQTKFNEELQRSIWADELELLKSDLTFRSLLRADEREFMRELETMSLDLAVALAAELGETEGLTRAFSGAGQLVEPAIKAYGAYEKSQEKKGETK